MVRVRLKQVKQVLPQEDAATVVTACDSVVGEILVIVSMGRLLLGNITVLELTL